MEAQQLRHFAAVGEELHFGRAARRLNIAQSALSQSIRRLEQSLGVTLLDRDGRKTNLTPAGVVFLRAAQDLVARSSRAVAMARRAAGEHRTLRISSFGPTRHSVLPIALRAFLRAWPDVQVELTDHSHPPDQLSDLREGRADIAFVNTAMGDLMTHSEGDDIAFETIERWPFVAAVPADTALAQHGHIRIAELRDSPFIVNPMAIAPRMRSNVVSACRESGFTPQIRHEVTHIFSMLSLVAAGQGVALVRASARSLVQEGVAFLLLIDAPPFLYQDMAIAWMRGETLFPLDRFVDAVRSCRDPALSAALTGQPPETR